VIREKVWLRTAYCSDIPLREGRAVRIASRDIAIFNLGGRFLAVENRCPHRGGPLADGIVSGGNVVCPLHAWKFNLENGAGISAPSQGSCVQTFATRVEDGIVLLEVPLGPEDDDEMPPACMEAEREWNWSQSVGIDEP
jgi:nitrite reductase (NADH) small subunit